MKPGSGRDPVRASVGIGALRFDESQATVASRISAEVLRSSDVAYRLDRTGLNVRAALQQLPLDVPLDRKTVKVELTRRGDDLVAKVRHASTSQPQAWWVTGETTVRSELRVPCAKVLPADVLTTGSPVVPSAPLATADGKTIRLALCCPVSSGQPVRIDGSVGSGTVGQAWTMPATGKAKPIAIYSPSNALSSGESVAVDPIHLVYPGKIRELIPESLWALPLVVPK